ncbi:hypothetical protein LB516_02995 [Mesorhizobium sp. CO1-1-7]|uniref:Uncharacterized protein n=1 Tax=Mesorhizobium australicum (strain HAMBI 3006 / LMG 24608 / WSM2073) TaxID=754035 RepID=L0KCQ5_MESAW|nr:MULTISPECIES: hypothetical protein [Mesorhizobium]AGB42776.1 hypothetical protein Mesau_00277 [Mesorhizobium australicum WSM2073]MBZ9680713.1 hypothetical protein [Mesorhizobium sp. CO1-1-2]MBZ9697521.1 hypothetical protein [Mesorhizobium sp. CO1-1-9]MBZ9744212.1 hypothetical protein [Mesorhizobium sp. CO1-1-7]MBZ9754660.1 hypothetical protein [Mesorhizobium sp. ESP6-5]
MPALAQTPTLSDVRQAIVRCLIDTVDRPCISISEVSHEVRRMFPLCELTDWELGDLIARSAIDAGFAVEFGADVP